MKSWISQTSCSADIWLGILVRTTSSYDFVYSEPLYDGWQVASSLGNMNVYVDNCQLNEAKIDELWQNGLTSAITPKIRGPRSQRSKLVLFTASDVIFYVKVIALIMKII